MSRSGNGFIVSGVVLIILQIVSFIGNASSDNGLQIQLSLDTLRFDIPYLIGNFLVGIIGIILLVIGIVKRIKG